MMACAAIKSTNPEALSALPNAPVIAPRPTGPARRWLVRLRASMAGLLHQAAWAVEPHFSKHQGSPELSPLREAAR